jgi:uncharacterized protein YecE (DUF72 family)
MGKIRIGISGWRYTPWRGEFYPDKLPEALELWYASRILSAIEINGSFYSLQRPGYYERWYADTPRDFVFAVKGGRYITHMKRLRDIETPLANFFASGVLLLREKFGPLLWQFPPNLRYDAARFEQFFELLPRDTRAAAELGSHHDHRLRGRTHLEIDRNRRLRHAVEIRHPSFLQEDFIAQLRNHRIALVVAESAGKWPLVHDVTADFVYCRLHGDKKLYRSGYSMPALKRWAARVAAWNRGSEPADAEKISSKKMRIRSSRDVFCFFDNTDDKLRAPEDAQTLMRLVKQQPGSPPDWRTEKPPPAHLRLARQGGERTTEL